MLEILENLPEEQLRELYQMYAALKAKEPAWKSIHERQRLAEESLADELFFGGGPGGGKSNLGLGLAFTRHKRTIIFRKTNPQFEEIENQLLRIAHGRGKYNHSTKIYKGFDGRQIELESLQHESDWINLQGRPHDLIHVDEAPQFSEKLVLFSTGWLRSDDKNQRVRLLLTGNPPTNAQGYWIKTRFGPWLDKRHPLYPTPEGKLLWVIRVDGKDEWVDGPGKHERKGETHIAKSRTFIAATYRDNPVYVEDEYTRTLMALPEPLRSQLLNSDWDAGEVDEDWQLFPSAWLQLSIDRGTLRKNDDHGKLLSVGIDVARGGQDRTALARLYADNWYDEIIAVPGKGTPSGADIERILTESIKNRLQDDPEINWDAIGVGSGASEYLSRLWKNPNPISVDGSSYGYDKSGRYQFQNLKAEIFWKFREALDPDSGSNVCLPDDREMFTEFTAHRWDISPTGQIRIGKKDDIKSKIGRSPDKAEAVLLAWFSRTRVKFGAAWG